MNKEETAHKKLTEGLPLVARQLCLEAMRLFTDQIDQGMTKKDLINNLPKAMTFYFETIKKSEPFDLNAIARKYSFNAEDIFSIPFHNSEFVDEVVDTFLPNTGELSDTDFPIQHFPALQTISALLVPVMSLLIAESKFRENDCQDYETYMKEIDPLIYTLHSTCHIAKSKAALNERINAKEAKIAGGKKGASNRSNRFRALNDLVIEECQVSHTDIGAAEAARRIYEKLGPDNTWLKDENEQLLLKDPVTRFTQWIRDFRRQAA